MSLITALPPDRPDLLPDVLHLQGHELLPAGCPILVPVAVDEFTPATLQVAHALATQRGAVPNLLYIMELLPYAMVDGNFGVTAVADTLLDPTVIADDEHQIRAKCGADKGAFAKWPFHIEMGQSASSIVSQARRLGAKCIVMGLHHHNVVGRMMGGDTLREVIAVGGIPVIAVLPSLTALPKSVVVAMDFSRASVRAARLAREMMDVRGTMHLVFVNATVTDPTAESDEGQRLIQTNGVSAAFEQVITSLDPAPGMTINAIQRSGAPVPELIAACEELGPELLAVGSQRHSFLERVRLGSVAIGLVNAGRWSVLVTPPATPAQTGQ